MSSPTPEPGPVVHPFAAVGSFAHWLFGAALGCLLGFCIGAVAARSMRARHLHWSWALVAFAPAAAMHSVLSGAGLPCAVAALCAARTGRRWHREDLDAGADLRDLAASRRSPFDALDGVARALGEWARACAPEPSGDLAGLALGRDERGRTVTIHVGAGRHTLVVGATGLRQDRDPDGDRRPRDRSRHRPPSSSTPRATARCSQRCAPPRRPRAGASCDWSPGGDTVYNPYARGSETEIADKALAGETLHRAPLPASGAALHRPRRPRAASGRRAGEPRGDRRAPRPEPARGARPRAVRDPRAAPHMPTWTPSPQGSAATCRECATGSRSSPSPTSARGWTRPRPARPRFELLQAVRAGATVYFDLESDRRPLLAQMLGAAIVQDLLTTVAALQGRPLPTLIVIDEFSAVPPGRWCACSAARGPRASASCSERRSLPICVPPAESGCWSRSSGTSRW